MDCRFIHHNMKRIFLFILILLASQLLFAQKNNYDTTFYRRHFIIAFDISPPFLRGFNSTPQLENTLIDLFKNQVIDLNLFEKNQENLLVERDAGLRFFDPDLDEISFYHFGIARQEINNLYYYSNSRPEVIINDFIQKFIKKPGNNWSTFRYDNPNIEDYLNYILSIDRTPRNFNNGVTLSNYVYPFIIEKVSSSTFAEEYILIILSDFISGSHFVGNRNDFLRLLEIYHLPYSSADNIPESSPPIMIRDHGNKLSNQLFQINYFEYAVTIENQQDNGNRIKLGIVGSKLLPKAGLRKPESIDFYIDSDIGLKQKKYLSNSFDLLTLFI